MSAKPIPEMHLELFREPGFFDDHFVKNWTVNSGSMSTDGDKVTITSGVAAIGNIEKSFNSLDTNIYTKIQIRVESVSGSWQVDVYNEDDLSWYNVWDLQSGTGLFEATLTTGLHITKVRIISEGIGTDKNVVVDYVAITKNALLVPTDTFDIESATLDRPILSMGVAKLEVELDNSDGAYTGKITDFDIVLFWLNETGASMKKMFGGQILQPGGDGKGRSKKYKTLIEAYDWGRELQAPPDIIAQQYVDVNGRVIINEAIDLCAYITKKFVDDENGDGTPDGDLASNHTIEFPEVIPYDIINKICGLTKTAGGFIGADGYVDPAGNCHIFKRGKFTSGVTPSIIHYTYKKDDLRIRNKTRVYGAQEKTTPLNKDTWTEPDADPPSGWTGETGTVVSRATDQVKVGSYSVKGVGSSPYVVRFYYTPTDEIKCLLDYDHLKLFFYVRFGDGVPVGSIFEVWLYDNQLSDSHKWERYITLWTSGEWHLVELDLGPEYENESRTVGWKKFGSPDWRRIKRIKFKTDLTGDPDNVWIDGLYFGDARFFGEAEDSVSIAKYGTLWQSFEVDDALKSDVECENRAKSIVEFLKDPVISLTLECDGDNGFLPGYQQAIALPKEGVDDTFRILRVRDVVKGTDWRSHLTLDNEPTKIDYYFALLFKDLKRLGKGTAVPGGGAAHDRPWGIRVGKAGGRPYDFETLQEANDAN